MENSKKKNRKWKAGDMPLDVKSNEDFNNQHPNHDENGLTNENVRSDEKNTESDIKESSDRNAIAKKLKTKKL